MLISSALVLVCPKIARNGTKHCDQLSRSALLIMTSEKRFHPTGMVPEALAAQVLDFMNEGTLGLLELAAAADVVAAECRYNYWVATVLKEDAGFSEEQWLRLLDAGEEVENRCRSAMAAFRTGGSVETLLNEFSAVAAFLNKRDRP
ncbi:hypothetical protein ACRAVF_02270 [Bradyrhizobium oligotrophicum S58]